MRVTISDQLADTYQDFAVTQGVPIDDVIQKQLARFATIPPGTTTVVLGPNHLDYLAEKLHGGDIKSAEDLIQKVDRLAGIKFQGIDLMLTPAQLEEVAHRAERQGKTPDQLVQAMWEHLSVNLLNTPTVGA